MPRTGQTHLKIVQNSNTKITLQKCVYFWETPDTPVTDLCLLRTQTKPDRYFSFS